MLLVVTGTAGEGTGVLDAKKDKFKSSSGEKGTAELAIADVLPDEGPSTSIKMFLDEGLAADDDDSSEDIRLSE